MRENANNRMNSGDSTDFSAPPNRPDGLVKCAKNVSGFSLSVDSQEGLEHLVRKQPSSWCEPNTIAVLRQQSIPDQYRNRRRQVGADRCSKTCSDLSQVHAAVQAQTEKESLLQRRVERNQRPIQRGAGNIFLQPIRGGK